MPEAGEYILSRAGFLKDGQPFVELQRSGQFIRFSPIGKTLTLRFATNTRYCVGWYDMSGGESFACPDTSTVDAKYEQCPACQKRTGFNPAFYNARVSQNSRKPEMPNHTNFTSRISARESQR